MAFECTECGVICIGEPHFQDRLIKACAPCYEDFYKHFEEEQENPFEYSGKCACGFDDPSCPCYE